MSGKGTTKKLSEHLYGVPQGSVSGSILYYICLNDLFFLTGCTDVCVFADNNTFLICEKDLSSTVNRLEQVSYLTTEWFQNKILKSN